MRWVPKEISLYLNEKEYIDTALIPIIPLSFNKGIKEAANQSEFVQLIGYHLEKQFKGRILLLPPLTYFLTFAKELKQKLLNEWLEKVAENGFKHIFFLTTDQEWKQLIEQANGECIWLPSIPLEHLDEKHKYSIIDNQVGQLLNIFVEKWQKNENVN